MIKRRLGMRRHRSVPLALLCLVGAARAFGVTAAPDGKSLDRLARTRVPFVENRGQLPDRVAFAASTFFGSALVKRDGTLVYSLRPSHGRPTPGDRGPSAGPTITESLLSGRPKPAAGARASTAVNYFLGDDPHRWRSDVPSYEELQLGEVWPGISVSLRAHSGSVEKLFEVRPGASVEKIRLRVDGARPLTIGRDGELVARTRKGDVRFAAPIAYQDEGGGRRPVEVAYVLRGSTYGFRLGRHDPALSVTIDPALQSTYLGGSGADSINAIAIHPVTGEVFVAGGTFSGDFPGIAATGHGPRGGEAFVARFDPTLSTLLNATYFGGSESEEALGVAVHPVSGEVFVAGITSSTDFPSTNLGAQAMSGGADDGFVARFDSTLRLLRATYVGANNIDKLVGVAVHPSNGDVYAAGYTLSPGSLPATAGGAQATPAGDDDGFVVRLDPTLSHVLQATYLGGPGPDYLRAITISASSGEILVAGETISSIPFPGTEGGANAYSPDGNFDGFVTRLDPTLTRILQSSYLGGGQNDVILGVAAHPATEEILVTGNFVNDFQGGDVGTLPPVPGGEDCFVARFNPTLTELRQATFLGGSSDDSCYGIAIHPSRGDVYVIGETFSPGLPQTIGAAQPSYGGHGDGFVARLDSTLTHLLQTTYLGGSDEDAAYAVAIQPTTGDLLASGMTFSADFPGAGSGARPTFAGGSDFGGDGFVSRLSSSLGDASQECVPDAETLCLNSGRFKVQVAWRVPSQGESGTGKAVAVTKDTGYFWFFNDANIELVLKILDARALDGHFWIFYGALSNVEYTITVTDMQTKRVRTYFNPDGRLASEADTAAFTDDAAVETGGFETASTVSSDTPSEAALYAGERRAALPEAAPCAAGRFALCLNQSHFQVSVDWAVPSQGTSGHGTAKPITSDTGYFWFFDSANVELMVKVLDGRAVNGKFWVFYGALSNVQYTITVTDTQTGTVKTYSNPSGVMASVADTAAF